MINSKQAEKNALSKREEALNELSKELVGIMEQNYSPNHEGQMKSLYEKAKNKGISPNELLAFYQENGELIRKRIDADKEYQKKQLEKEKQEAQNLQRQTSGIASDLLNSGSLAGRGGNY